MQLARGAGPQWRPPTGAAAPLPPLPPPSLHNPGAPSCALAPAGMGLIRGLIHEAVDAISGDKVAAPQPQARSAPAANGADDKVTKE